MQRISRNSVGLAGEYAVLSQLMLQGYDAGMTLGNTKNIDILVSHPKSRKHYKVEVKTNLEFRKKPGNSNSKLFGQLVTGWQMNEKHERVKDPEIFYCFVNINSKSKDISDSKFSISLCQARLSLDTSAMNIGIGKKINRDGLTLKGAHLG